MAESARPKSDFPPETPIPAVSLKSILCTGELQRRPRRPPDHEKENRALVALAGALADSPRTILQTLADKVCEVLDADSSGLSLLTKDQNSFVWPAVAGAWRPYIGAGAPRNFAPCGVVLDHNVPMLFTHWERRYPYLGGAMPLAEEGLIVPFYVNGKAAGTIWAVAHDHRRKFDAEDLRLLESMGRFASAAYQTVESVENLKCEVVAREKAEAAVRELANGLETKVRVRTHELECSTQELLDTNKQLEREIAERKRAEEALRKSERDLNLIINTMPALAWSARPDGSADFFNQHYLSYAGLSVEQLQGWGWTSAVHPDDLSALADDWQSIKASGEHGEAEARLRRFDGTYRWFLFRVNPMRDESGAIIKWFGTNTDIEDRKRGEVALRASELSWRQIVDNIPGFIATMGAMGEVEFLNRQTLEYFGKTNEELKNWSLIGAVHPDDLPRVIEARIKTIETGQLYDVEHRCRRADGVYRWFQVRGLPVRDTEGRVTSWYLLLTDIEERKQAEDKLRRSEAFLAEGQHLARMGNFSWRIDTDEIMWSEQLYRIFEFDREVPVTLTLIASRVHPEDLKMADDMIAKARGGVSDFEYEHRLLMHDGSIKYLHLMAHGSRDAEGGLEYIGAVQDVTQRRASEEALAKVRSEFAHVARVTSLGTLTASIAHEVNQPLSGIILNANTCLRMLAADPPNVDGARETARRTIRDGNRASDVITRLRALFAKRDVAFEAVDLNDALQEVIALSRDELQRHRVIVHPELADNLPPATGDRIQLQQVILNLLRNASDAMSAVDDRPRELLIRTERDQGDQVRLSVKDAGVGLDSQAVDKLFDAFYTTKNGGMGIGLSVSRSIIESHRGRLWATPNEGPGVTFSFSIPCRSEGATGARGPKSGDQAPASTDAA